MVEVTPKLTLNGGRVGLLSVGSPPHPLHRGWCFPGGARLDVQHVNHSPARNNRGDYDHHSIHTHDQFWTSFPGVYYLRGEFYHHHVPHYRLDDIRPHCGDPQQGSTTVKVLTALLAVALRSISFLFALLNATGLVVLSCLHFSDFLDNCYCNASVTSRGAEAYVIISFPDWIPTMRAARIVGTTFAAVSISAST